MNHTFVICAYKESPYLRDCIRSLREQEISSRIIMVTSTPNDYIRKLAEEYQIPLYINEGEAGITQDWNFGLAQVKTAYATVAHQDDIYDKDYLSNIRRAVKHSWRPIIVFTDYYEIREEKRIYKNLNLRIKRFMLFPLLLPFFSRSRFVRRRILSFGDPVCCPSVTFCLKRAERPVFQNHFRSCEDWEAWERLSRLKGSFVYVGKPLMGHRIHAESETTAIINDNKRKAENMEMYHRFWPGWAAKAINTIYSFSERSNDV